MLETSGPLSFIAGWLKYYNYSTNEERKLFCLVNTGLLTLSSDEKQTEIILQIEINDILSVEEEEEPNQIEINNDKYFYKFSIYLENGKFTFGCQSFTQMKKWIVVLTPERYNLFNMQTTLDDFTIIDKIGSGYSGEVLLAKYKATNQLYALKSIPKENIAESKVTRAFSERNILMEASHPFITRLISTFQTEDKLYLVLEYVQGGDLLHHINKGLNLKTNQIKLYLAEIATALSYLHYLGIVFRDLKPSNILIGKDGHLKLTDFGLSRYLIDNNICYSFCGTNEYLAPEIIQNEGYNFAVDWWSFGILAYLLFEGALPFRSLNLTKLFNQITSSPLRFLKKLPDDITDLIEKLLTKDPKKRLGCGVSGDKEIFEHPFFKGIDWNDVYDRKCEPLFKPYLETEDDEYLCINQNITSSLFNNLSRLIEERRGFAYHFKDFSFNNFEELSCF